MNTSSKHPEVKTAQFIRGIKGSNPILEDGLPHIVFSGRSNVGKSSLLNSLTGQKRLAVSSVTPGRTREMNFFLINNKKYFVDLPGYGFARMPTKEAERMRKMLVWYLSESGIRPQMVLLVIDAKAGITKLDEAMLGLLEEANAPLVVVANKIDKFSQKERVAKLRQIGKSIPNATVIAYSTKTGEGREELLKKILSD